MLIALPELDGATTPTVFAGRHGEVAEKHSDKSLSAKQMAPCKERIEKLAARVEKLAHLLLSSR